MRFADNIAVIPRLPRGGTSPRHGALIRINNAGLCFIEENTSGRRYVFTFDKIVGYAGQSPGELGLRIGRQLRFLSDAEQVEEVYLCHNEREEPIFWPRALRTQLGSTRFVVGALLMVWCIFVAIAAFRNAVVTGGAP